MHRIVFLLFGVFLGAILPWFADRRKEEKDSPVLLSCHGNRHLDESDASKNDPSALLRAIPDPDVGRDGSSVWCTGSEHTDRMCKFRNLCYAPGHDSFVFFHGRDTVVQGVPENRFDPALLDMTSVSDHNTQYFDFVDLRSSDVSKFAVTFHHGNSFVFNRFNPDNLMHVLHDDLLPLFVTLMQVTQSGSDPFGLDTRLVLMEGWPPGENFELYQLFSHQPVLLKSDFAKNSEESLVCFQSAFVGLSKSSVWYQYGFNEPQGPVRNTKVTATQIRQFTRFVRRRLDINVDDSSSDPFIVILSRKINRLILNESEVMFSLIQEFGLRVITVSYETHSLKEQIRIASKASVLVGVHGSLLTLSMFLPQWAVIVEIFPYAVNPENYTPYKTLASLPGMNLVYRAWKNARPENTVTHPDYPPHLGGIGHLPDPLQREILQSSEVPVHLCCKDPQWLFRIYQDTIIDVPSFIHTVQEALSESRTRKSQESKEHYHGSLYATKVRNLTCQVFNLNNQDYSNEPEIKSTNQESGFKGDDSPSANQQVGLKVSFEPPWNLPYLGAEEVRYEVWIQESGQEKYSAWLLPHTEHVFTENIKQGIHYFIWVRCITSGHLKGPFSIATT